MIVAERIRHAPELRFIDADNAADRWSKKEILMPIKPFSFILHWYLWQVKYRDELSKLHNRGFGYRAGVFHPNGSKYGQHHDDWPAFFDSMAALGWTYLDIESQFCYNKYPSCKAFIDTSGASFPFP